MKRNYWPVFFISIFSFTFGMIVWTIISTSKASIHEDRSFSKTYQEVDVEFNNIMISNMKFKSKYDLILSINDKEVKLSTDDIKYSQRVLEKIKKHRNLLHLGSNSLNVKAYDKKSGKLKDLVIELKVTKSNSNESDFILDNKSFSKNNELYKTNFDINEENNWNITGSFKIDEDTAYIYIKTNAS